MPGVQAHAAALTGMARDIAPPMGDVQLEVPEAGQRADLKTPRRAQGGRPGRRLGVRHQMGRHVRGSVGSRTRAAVPRFPEGVLHRMVLVGGILGSSSRRGAHNRQISDEGTTATTHRHSSQRQKLPFSLVCGPCSRCTTPCGSRIHAVGNQEAAKRPIGTVAAVVGRHCGGCSPTFIPLVHARSWEPGGAVVLVHEPGGTSCALSTVYFCKEYSVRGAVCTAARSRYRQDLCTKPHGFLWPKR